MDLGEFIRRNHGAIVSEWEAFAATLAPAARGLSNVKLRDHARQILAAIVADIESPQAAREQSEKSKGRGLDHRMQAVGQVHAALRIQDGFKLGQLVAEYRALRASVLRLYEEAGGGNLGQVIRFNEAIDEALVEATNRYIQETERTRDQFLAVLGHDLRNPLGAILMSSALLATPRGGEAAAAEDRTAKVAMRILTSAQRMKRMVTDLLDLTRTRLGVGIPIAPHPTNLDELAQGVLAEFQALHPDRRFDFRSEGNLWGVWDSDRLAQVLSNLVGNALQHGAPGRPVAVVARAEAEGVVLEVHNEGPTIPPSQLANIFEPLVRNPKPEEQSSTSLGLGLYIAREIATAHGGTVMVTSTDREGTTFGVRLPRRSAAQALGEPPEPHGPSGEAVIQ